jgi:ADP-ribosyl-[dinitrogen reductase] hydrolase
MTLFWAMSKSYYSQLKGLFFGLIVGDVLGAPIEFMEPGTFEPLTDFSEGGAHKIAVGEWTDDTSLALAIADALIRRQGELDLKLILDNFLAWYKSGKFSSRDYCFDIGNTTKRALLNYRATGDLEASTKRDEEVGNGSLMRMAPMFVVFSTANDLLEKNLQVSRTTHSHPKVDAYVITMNNVISDLLNGVSKEEIILRYPVDETCRPTGFAGDTFNVALRSFFKTSSFEEGLLLTVNQGYDADTAGAVYGQIAGAYYGYEAIPGKWIEKLYLLPMLQQVFDDLWKIKHPLEDFKACES